MAHDTVTSTSTCINTKGHIISLNNHLNMRNTNGIIDGTLGIMLQEKCCCNVFAKNLHAPEMPYIFPMCQLVHMHISYNYVIIHALYECIPIKNVTKNTDIYTFHTEQICL